MFPRNGAKVPELRLAGFSDNWEQCKLGEIIRAKSFKAYLAEPQIGGKYEVVQQGENPVIGYANGIPYYDYNSVVLFGDHTLSLYKPKMPFFVATDGVRIISGTKEIDGDFLYYLLERYKPKTEGYKRYYTILVDRECFFTTNLSEQKQIGKVFLSVDNLITLHQHKLNAFQNEKQGLMQQLFI